MDPRARPLLEADVDPDPVRQFERWFGEAGAAGIRAPEAMTLATASADGLPSARMVLMKDFGVRGFVFYTGYESRKGRDLAENPRAALLFHWDELGRQVRVEGPVERVTRAESEAYFRSRPRGAQLGAAASRQSEPIPSRETLETSVAAVAERVGGNSPPLPEHWGGFRLAPESFEFWQHREDRLHDRLRYRRERGRWILERLSP